MSAGPGPVLAGDVGGTHARLALFEVGGGSPRLGREVVYASAEYDGLEAVVAQFLRETGVKVERACIAVAGPVEGGVYRFPNLRALNFVIRGLLQEGVAASTRQDAQAKALGEWLRARVVSVPSQTASPFS